MKKLKLLSLFLVAVIVIFALTGCDMGTQKENEDNEEYTEQVESIEGYSIFEGNGYSVQYKNDWTTDETPLGSLTARVFLSPEGTSTINIIKEDLPIKYTIEQYKAASLTNLKNTYATAEFKEEKIKVSNLDAYRIEYEAEVNGINVKISQTLIVKDKVAFIITYSGTEDQAAEVYSNMEKTFMVK